MDNINEVSLKELWPIMKEQIDAGKKVRLAPKGTSMLPLIRQGVDSVILETAPMKLKKYDIPLYLRENGQFVLHRVVEVKKDSYTCCGDNQILREHGVKHSQILALATGMYRGDEFVSFTDEKYIKYSKKQVLKKHIGAYTNKIRSFLARIKHIIKRILGK